MDTDVIVLPRRRGRRLKGSDPLAEAAYKGGSVATRVYIGEDIDADDVEFGRAMDFYKRRYQRPFPSYSEVLAVLRSLGYRKDEAQEVRASA